MGVDPRAEEALRRFAATAQNGVLRLDQLRGIGLSWDAVRARVQGGRLFHVGPRVYATADPALLALAHPTAVLLSLGDDALLTHRASVALRGWAAHDPALLDVTVVGRRVRPRGGVRLHRVKSMHPADVQILHNLRISAPARALIEFAADATAAELSAAFGEARVKGRLTDRALQAALNRLPANDRGAAVVRALLRDGATYDRSDKERKLRRLLKAAGLPQPRVNAFLHGVPVDFLWPEAKLIVEVDGHDGHGHRHAFERDRRRDQILVAHGYTVIRVTARQLDTEPLAVITRIAQALARRAAA